MFLLSSDVTGFHHSVCPQRQCVSSETVCVLRDSETVRVLRVSQKVCVLKDSETVSSESVSSESVLSVLRVSVCPQSVRQCVSLCQ